MRAVEHESAGGSTEEPTKEGQGVDQGASKTHFETKGTIPPVLGSFHAPVQSASDRAFGHGRASIAMTSDGPAVEHEPENITQLREYLKALDPTYGDPSAGRTLDHDHEQRLLQVVKQILEKASTDTDADEARRLLDLIRRYGLPNKYPQIQTLITNAEHEINKKPATAAPSATIPAVTAAFDWTSHIVHDKTGTHVDTISAADTAKLAAIAAGRPAKLAAERAKNGERLTKDRWVPYQGRHGWMYSGDASKFSMKPTGDKVVDAAAKELFVGGDTGASIEASPSGVVTYDGTVSVGGGWANGAAAEYLGRWFAKDHSARALLLDVGFTVTADHQFAVIDNTGKILVGEPARQYLLVEGNGGLLDYMSGLIEQPGHSELAMEAQTEQLKEGTTDKIKEPLKTEIKSWPPHAIAAAIHLGHWDPQGGPVINPNDYSATHGDAVKMVQAFAMNMHAYVKQANGAYVLGSSGNTATPYSGHLDRFGDHYLKGPLDGEPTVRLTCQQAATDPAYAGSILILTGTAVWDLADPHPHVFINTGTRRF